MTPEDISRLLREQEMCGHVFSREDGKRAACILPYPCPEHPSDRRPKATELWLEDIERWHLERISKEEHEGDSSDVALRKAFRAGVEAGKKLKRP